MSELVVRPGLQVASTPLPSSKSDLYRLGVAKSSLFLRVNGIAPPSFTECERTHWAMRFGNCGLYERGRVFVAPGNCAAPATSPGNRKWSYPGYKVDRTPVGVVAHEVGHHVWRARLGSDHRSAWARIARATRRITSYEPNVEESFAESMKLFITNPDLLRRAVPARYAFIVEVVQPSERRSFAEVLGNHPAYVRAATNWIDDGR